MALSPERREELIAGALAQHELDAARRGRYEDVHKVAHGQTMASVMRNVTTLMDALADPECWLLAADPLEWRYVMINVLQDQMTDFYALAEGAMGGDDGGEVVMIPNPPPGG